MDKFPFYFVLSAMTMVILAILALLLWGDDLGWVK